MVRLQPSNLGEYSRRATSVQASEKSVREQELSQQPLSKMKGFPRRPDQHRKKKGAQVTRESGGNRVSRPSVLAPAPWVASRADGLF